MTRNDDCNSIISIGPRHGPVRFGRPDFAGTGGERPPRDDNRFILRALDPATGKRVWQYPMTGPTTMWAGTVSTAGGAAATRDSIMDPTRAPAPRSICRAP